MFHLSTINVLLVSQKLPVHSRSRACAFRRRTSDIEMHFLEKPRVDIMRTVSGQKKCIVQYATTILHPLSELSKFARRLSTEEMRNGRQYFISWFATAVTRWRQRLSRRLMRMDYCGSWSPLSSATPTGAPLYTRKKRDNLPMKPSTMRLSECGQFGSSMGPSFGVLSGLLLTRYFSSFVTN